MPIRSVPFNEITVDLIRTMVDRRIAEDRTLDFKLTFAIDGESDQLDFLKDVTAMANASGGTILYGAAEGDGDDRGILMGLTGIRLAKDAMELTVSNLLRDGVDERISGVQHRAIPFDSETYLSRILQLREKRTPPGSRM